MLVTGFGKAFVLFCTVLYCTSTVLYTATQMCQIMGKRADLHKVYVTRSQLTWNFINIRLLYQFRRFLNCHVLN